MTTTLGECQPSKWSLPWADSINGSTISKKAQRREALREERPLFVHRVFFFIEGIFVSMLYFCHQNFFSSLFQLLWQCGMQRTLSTLSLLWNWWEKSTPRNHGKSNTLFPALFSQVSVFIVSSGGSCKAFEKGISLLYWTWVRRNKFCKKANSTKVNWANY